MAIHTIFNGTKCMYWDNDALNAAGINATADMDCGTFVTRGALTQDSSNNITGYQFALTLPLANATDLYVVKNPTVGTGVDNIYDDPRQYYVKMGEVASIAKLVAGVDFIEVTAQAFASATAPTTTNKYCSVNTSGLLVAGSSAPASGTYFTLEGFHTIDVGTTLVPSYVLSCTRN